MQAIKFMKHYITDGVTKVRVNYSRGEVYFKGADGKYVQDANGRLATKDSVTIYAKERGLSKLFEGVQNDSDSMTDYFEQDRLRFYHGDAMFEAAAARCA